MQHSDVGDQIMEFNLDSQLGRIAFHEIIDGKWCLLVTFISSFDPVATTDFGMLSKLTEEFDARNLFIIAVGNDSVSNIRKWVKDIEELQIVRVKFALLSDPDCSVLSALGCARPSILSNEMKPCSLGTFLIDVDKRIRYSNRNSPMIGRNWYEILRQFDALTMCTTNQVVCPANWGTGQDVMLHPECTVEDATAANLRYVEIRPWFRLTPSPQEL